MTMPTRLFCAITVSSAVPQVTVAIGKAGRDIHRERQFVFPQQWIGPAQEILVAIFKSQTDEAPLEIILDETSMHLIQRDDIDACARKTPQEPFKKFGGDFEVPVRLKRRGALRPHMMQRQDRTYASDKRTHPMVHATEVKRLQPAADNGLLQLCEAPRRTPSQLTIAGLY